jgi:hypothetical protein
MFKVSTINLAPDARSAAADLGTQVVGELDAGKLLALLEAFRELDSIQNVEADPQIAIQAHGGKFAVRTGHKKLFLYNARNATEPAVELTADEIVAQLDRTALAAATPVEEPTADVPPSPNRGLAVALFVVGLIFIGYALYSAFNTDLGNKPPTLTAIDNSTELAAFQRTVIGTYMTGQELGHQGLIVEANGSMKFFQVLSHGQQDVIPDAYRIGRHETKLCLATKQYGALIEVIDHDTLAYAGGTYKRVK